MAAGSSELHSFVAKFAALWKTGKSARMSLECEAGKIIFNLQLQLSPHHPPQHEHHPSKKKESPSRLRRRARRAEARLATAAQAAASSLPTAPLPQEESGAAAQAATPVHPEGLPGSAVEADQPLPRDRASEAVQVVTPQLKHRDDAAGQADLVDSVYGPAGQAAGHDAVEPPQPHIVHDQVCNDLDYLKLLMEAQSEENKARNERRRKEHEEDLANFSKMIEKSCQF